MAAEKILFVSFSLLVCYNSNNTNSASNSNNFKIWKSLYLKKKLCVRVAFDYAELCDGISLQKLKILRNRFCLGPRLQLLSKKSGQKSSENMCVLYCTVYSSLLPLYSVHSITLCRTTSLENQSIFQEFLRNLQCTKIPP